jgi:hypothetical protein
MRLVASEPSLAHPLSITEVTQMAGVEDTNLEVQDFRGSDIHGARFTSNRFQGVLRRSGLGVYYQAAGKSSLALRSRIDSVMWVVHSVFAAFSFTL